MEQLPINITDGAILVLLAISAIFGFIWGFAKGVLTVSGWVGSVFATLYAFPHLKGFTREFIPNLLVADIVTGAVFFILCLVILSYITHAISEKVKASALGALDRTLGIFFGMAGAIVLVGIGWLIFVQFIPPKNHPEAIMEAKMLPIVMASGEFVARLTPPEMQENLLAALKTGQDAADSVKQGYEAIPEGVRDDVEKNVKEALETLDKGYDSQSRQQMENLTKGTQVTQ
ncbi:CvpA family protein [Sneathiella chinensis]|uniref:Colicin V biosynthesis protein n=1 Tax=Sneathiella chinensis TaxID=349750 RepID=A0ABQ5U6P2_9PROT|nr:CvpA family protein [Sneathiella chinensis]GLQ07589.1 colicin V biosynthesis protein [Sneathiella chinensis]